MQGHAILKSYPTILSGKAPVETDEPSGSVSEALAEESSDDDDENNSPPRANEEVIRKRKLEFASESADAGKDGPSDAPNAPTVTSGPSPTPDLSAREETEVIDAIPLAYKHPPPAKKPRVSTRWNIYNKVPVINVECDR